MSIKLIETTIPLKEKGFDEPLVAKNGRVANILTKLTRIYQHPIDVENTTFTKISPSEVNIKTNNVLFVFKLPQHSYRKGNYVEYEGCLILKGGNKIMGKILEPSSYELENGEKVYYDRKKDLSVASPAFCKQYANTAYILDDELKLLKDIRRERQQAQAGSINRDQNGYSWGMKTDKSGYLFDPEKYKKMLAAVRKESYQKYFDEAITLYNKLATYIRESEQEEMSLDSDLASGYINSRVSEAEKAIKNMRSNLVYFASAFRKNKPDEIVHYAKYIQKGIPELRKAADAIGRP